MLKETLRSCFNMSKKVIVIAGTTGVGKSQLSIQLAKQFNGEIINSDSMQVYKDVPIMTNKHPLQEREGIPHHVMNHVGWSEEYYSHRFETECMKAIEDIHQKGKIPIVVGGTHYYLQTLFNKKVDTKSSDRILTAKQLEILQSTDPDVVYNTLLECDPDIASKYHPNDYRRVQRMLEIYYKTGKKPSETFNEQKITLKFDTLFLWLYSKPEPLFQRLDDRVDDMLERGALQEIEQLYEYYNRNKFSPEQCENGVWQVIGFKEFLPWLSRKPDDSTVQLEDCIERMKTRTRQYAKRQVKWIKKMLIPDIKGDIYLLDATDLSQWDVTASQRAIAISNNFINNVPIEQERAPEDLRDLLSEGETTMKKLADWTHFTCNVCRNQDGKNVVAIGQKYWNIHLSSRRHKSNLKRSARQADFEKWKIHKRDNVE
ncbi:hypothetical protein SMKI_15G4090 [Saccharomyces mikatae IFO 1815]|uniref:tRNA dimethylallyltransferase n=1 Tax=Saccharomyces mikatae IFO 1815 TaxID=226126 RepID=A0AA35IW59_SACMI|nr:uncharacterized protein SMKI_15G4090 [Saccharomyces mikatae IFO 1815]CAI4036561.1 hypothetical protein SMKI_15G4090 [Saccharomyces mikatae IFO 1815]